MGEIEVRGLKMPPCRFLAATILTKEPCINFNVPLIEDVMRLIDIIKSMGAGRWLEEKKDKNTMQNINRIKFPKKVVGYLRVRPCFGDLYYRVLIISEQLPRAET